MRRATSSTSTSSASWASSTSAATASLPLGLGLGFGFGLDLGLSCGASLTFSETSSCVPLEFLALALTWACAFRRLSACGIGEDGSIGSEGTAFRVLRRDPPEPAEPLAMELLLLLLERAVGVGSSPRSGDPARALLVLARVVAALVRVLRARGDDVVISPPWPFSSSSNTALCNCALCVAKP